MHAPTLVKLLLAPVLTLVLLDVLLRHYPPFWQQLERFPPLSPTAAESRAFQARGHDVELAVLGSSVAWACVDETQLSWALRGEVVNLAIGGASMYHLAMFFPHAEAVRPKRILVMVPPPSLYNLTPKRRMLLYHPAIAWQLEPRTGWLTEPAVHLHGTLEWFSVAYRYRRVPKAFLNEELIDEPDFLRPEEERSYSVDVASRRRPLRHINREALASLALMKKRAERIGAEFYIVAAPVNPGVYGSAVPVKFDQDLERVARRLDLELLEVEHERFRQSHFRDRWHIGATGRREYTEALAEALR